MSAKKRTTLGSSLVMTLGALLLVLVGADPVAAAEPVLTAEAIVKKALSHTQFGLADGEATLRMVIEDKRGRLLERTLRSRSATVDGARRTRITFTQPSDQRGVEVLLLEDPAGDDQQYLYLPRLGERRRVAGNGKNGRFEGSDFSYADLENRDARRGRFTRLPDAEYGKQPVYRVDVEGDAQPGAAYSKVSLWISKQVWLPVKVMFYDRDGRASKILKVTTIRKVAGSYASTKLEMSNLVEGSRTRIELLSFDGDARFPASIFEPASLGR